MLELVLKMSRIGTTDDVIQWLKEKKLQTFEDVLSRFTGETLWELYKLKLDSPPEYHRQMEALLSCEQRYRLFYILTLNAAMESLFASSDNTSIINHFPPSVFLLVIFSILVLGISLILAFSR